VIDEIDPIDPAGVRRVVFCQGKVYYELLEARRARGLTDVALVRVELLHPFPADAIRAVVDRFPATAEVVWAQEEPRNMGAWPMYLDWFTSGLPNRYWPRYVGRPASASPATGSHHQHGVEQARVIDDALAPV
jgi:2-oxoglutarate dehydrogenase E1 component